MAGNLVPKDGKGPKLIQNGGLLEAEVERFESLKREGGNGWRITRYKVTKGWDNGAGVMDVVRGEEEGGN